MRKPEIPMNREYGEVWDSPRWDDRNNHSEVPIRRVDGVLQGKGVVEIWVGQVYGGAVSLFFPLLLTQRTETDKGRM